MRHVMNLSDKNLKIEAKPLYRTWYDVVETYRRPNYKMLGFKDVAKLVKLIYRKPLTIKELDKIFSFPYNEYGDRQLRLTLATLITTGVVEATRRLKYCNGRPPYQYESKYKTITEAESNSFWKVTTKK
jgi:hypothetical protein